MQALWFNGPNNIEVGEAGIPTLQSDELLLHVDGCGVCGTDFHIFRGEAPAKAPVVLGHEYSGTIIDSGNKSGKLKIGDKIAVNPNIHCGFCSSCRAGKINLCENLRALGVTINGGMSQYSVVPVTQAHLLPKDFPFNKSVFAEPVSCCIHGINQADIIPGEQVVIVGAGTIGLIMLQLAQLRGASKVIVLDPVQAKRNMAEILNADFVLDSADANIIENIIEITSGGADTVIECVGSQSAAESALKFVRKGGKIVIFGLANNTATLNIYLQSFFHKELTIKSSVLNPNTFQASVDLIVNNKINLELFNPYPVPLKQDKIQNLFNGLLDETVIKFMVTPNS
jgi:2-desacetyl-2-hydroxyethyl bacteriochlorophyllide A dehydrogenase